MKHLIAVGFLAALTGGCATPTVVDTRQIGDDRLSCRQLKIEIEEANRFENDAQKDRSVTGKNVAAVVLFWPALLATYANTEEAIKAARDRRQHLMKIADQKRC